MNSDAISIHTVQEERRGDAPLFVHPGWAQAFPWLVQGTTGRDAGNFASFGSQSAETVQAQWKRLREWTGMKTAVLGRQVHGAHVVEHGDLSAGMMFADDSDGHITTARGVLLAVSIADCVPVFVVDAEARQVAALHAGWRGTAAGILSNCLALMGNKVHVHLGPAICGSCYVVGPEVHEQLGLAVPPVNACVNLREVLYEQCIAAGVSSERMTMSAWCTRCNDSPFYSHRGGHPERQVAVIGIR